MSAAFKRAVIIGGLAVATLGAGGVAWAASTDSAPGSATAAAASHAAAPTTTSAAKGGHHVRRDAELRADHATWVTGRDGKFVTHQEIRGTVTAVNSTSITVKAVDGYSETFKVTSATKVHLRGAAKGQTTPITAVKTGDRAGVLGTGATDPTAARVVAGTAVGKTSTGSTTTTTG